MVLRGDSSLLECDFGGGGGGGVNEKKKFKIKKPKICNFN
jgi:hypothetical protein